MLLSKIKSCLLGFCAGKKSPSKKLHPEEFAVLNNSFRMFLSAWNRFQEVETKIAHTLCCDHPFGIYKVRSLCTDVALQVFQCIRQLQRLDSKHCADLHIRFGELQKAVVGLVYEPGRCQKGDALLGFEDAGKAEADARLLSPASLRLIRQKERRGDLLPDGFFVSFPGSQLLLGNKEFEAEVNRRIQAAGGFLPRKLDSLSGGIQELACHIPCPKGLSEPFLQRIENLRRECSGKGDMRLLFAGRLWPLDGEEERAGLLLWGASIPLLAPDADLLKALQETLALKYSAQAMVYLRARGITANSSGFCVSCFAVEEGSKGGVAYSSNPLDASSSHVRVYACEGLPEELETSRIPADFFMVDSTLPDVVDKRNLCGDIPSVDDRIVLEVAKLAASLARERGRPQSVVWSVSKKGTLKLLSFRDLSMSRRLPMEAGSVDKKAEASPFLTGGFPVSFGVGTGRAVVARSWDDVRRLPSHPLLVVEKDDYLWVGLVGRIEGIIAEKGQGSSRLASMCREFGIPALFGVEDATRKIAAGDLITFCAERGGVWRGNTSPLAAEAESGRVDYMPDSPVYTMLKAAAERILPSTLDPESLDFTAANCKTYHDIASYCHAKAIDAMFALGSGKGEAAARVRQLWDGVVKQFWVVNLGGAFAEPLRSGPLVDIKDVSCLPMQALWRGMNAYPWEGPPPVDGKGFLSVLFEATTNPHLDPAAQTKFFSEKNYFLVSKEYVSLQSRFGFHFVSVESRLGVRTAENYVAFHLRGGAADIERRTLRVNFVGDILWEFGFRPDIWGDSLTARLESVSLEEGKALLLVAGFLSIHTRQIDMIMLDRKQVARRKEELLERARTLYTSRAEALD